MTARLMRTVPRVRQDGAARLTAAFKCSKPGTSRKYTASILSSGF